MALERSMAGEGPVALAADVAADAGVHFHVLLQSRLGLETLPAQQAEDGHVRACTQEAHLSHSLVMILSEVFFSPRNPPMCRIIYREL